MKSESATATVTITLDIKIDSCWGDDCTLAQVKKQALVGAMSIINRAIAKAPEISITAKAELIKVIHSY